jgi:hypothetical protein
METLLMSIDRPDPKIADLSQLKPAVLEGRLRDLIRAYVARRSAALAEAVVAHLEALCVHVDTRDPGLFCAYRRLLRHWRWLAHQAPAALPG